MFYIPLVIIILLALVVAIEIKRAAKSVKLPRKVPVITPDDLNKEPRQLRNKMDKVWLKLEDINHQQRGMKQDLDHKAEINADIDIYISNMKPFVVICANDLKMPPAKYAHIGYSFQGDFFDLDGKHLYHSARWVPDLNEHLLVGKAYWYEKLTPLSILKAILAISLLFALAGAALANEPTPLTKGDISPYTGILMPEPTMRSIRADLIDLDAYKRQAELYKQNQVILQEQSTMWQNQANNLSEQLVKEKTSFWGRASYFLAGAGITVALAFATRQATK